MHFLLYRLYVAANCSPQYCVRIQSRYRIKLEMSNIGGKPGHATCSFASRMFIDYIITQFFCDIRKSEFVISRIFLHNKIITIFDFVTSQDRICDITNFCLYCDITKLSL